MHGRREIDNGQDMIDSRDVIRRIADLESEREGLADAITDAEDEDTRLNAEDALTEWDGGDDAAELKALKTLADDAEGYASDWHHGESLIRDSYFETYARETAEDLHGAALRNASWPFDCIDWDRAVEALQMDYTQADYDGITYWVRCS